MDQQIAITGKAKPCRWALVIAMAAATGFTGERPAFQRLLPPMGGYVNSMGATPTRLFATGTIGSHYRDFDAARWNEIQDPLTRLGAGRIHTYGDMVVFDQGGGQAVLSLDNGKTWRPLVYASGETKDWFWLTHVGRHGIFYSAGFFEAPRESFGFFRSVDTGKTWTRHLTVGSVYSIADMGEDLAVSLDSGVYRFRLLDHRYEKMTVGPWKPPVWFRLNGNGTGDVLASQDGTPIYKYSATSKTWVAVLSGSEEHRFFSVEMVGSQAFAHAYAVDEEEFLHRSTDGGATWEPARNIGKKQTTLLVAGGETAYLATTVGLEAYHWPTRTWSVDSAGRRANMIAHFRVLGSSVLTAIPSGEPNLGRSDDLGGHWNRILPLEHWPSYLFRSRENLFYQQSARMVRYDLGMASPDTLPPLDFQGGVVQFEDAGSMYYARANIDRWGNRQPLEADYLVTLEKGSAQWSPKRHPFGLMDELAAEGKLVLVRRKDSLGLSRDAGVSWTRLAGLPFRSPRGIFRHAGNWFATTENGLFKSDAAGFSWLQLGLPSRPYTVLAHSANRILVQAGPSTVHLSSDRGSTWQELALPVQGEFMQADLSDSLLCIYGETKGVGGVDTYCLELGPLPTGTRPVWTRMSAPDPRRFLSGNRFAFRKPGAGGLVQADGRQAPLRRR